MAGHSHPIDRHVGRRLRLRRSLIGMSQERLGERLGVTFQQVQKYEGGANRIGASRLYDIALILGVPVGYFYEEYEEQDAVAVADHEQGHGLAEGAAPFTFDTAPPPAEPASPVESRETLEMVRAFNRIDDPQVRRRLFDLAKALAKTSYIEDEAPSSA